MKCADENVHEEPSITEEAVPKLETASYCRGGQIRTDDLPARRWRAGRDIGLLHQTIVTDQFKCSRRVLALLQLQLKSHCYPFGRKFLQGNQRPWNTMLGCFGPSGIVSFQPVRNILRVSVVILPSTRRKKDVNKAHISTEEAVPNLETASFCRGGQIRTDDLLLPKQARYRATLRPEFHLSHIRIADLPASFRRDAIPGYATPRNSIQAPFERTHAERGGFEPPVQNNPYGSLANYWFKPLTHLSFWAPPRSAGRQR